MEKLLAEKKSQEQSIVSGESGAVTTGIVQKICSNDKYSNYLDVLGLDDSSSVFCISTEGDTNPDLYNQALGNQ